MRKHLIFAAVAAFGALIISSCQREKDVETYTVKSDEVSLVLGGIATRSEVAKPVIRTNYDLGEVIEGVKLSLEEVVTDMGALTDDVAETRGTPVYTQNVTDVHGTAFRGEVHGAAGRVAPEGSFEVINLSGGRKAWRRGVGYDVWKKANGPVTFFVHMPSMPVGMTNLVASYAANSIEFDYATPSTASEQEDILFGARNIDFDTYFSEYQSNGGASVLFRHALTGVKFAIGNNTTKAGNRTPDGEIQTFITKVEITGLKDKGHAKFVPDESEETNTDVADKFSSASSFTWTDGNTSPTRTTVWSQTFGDDDIQDYKSGDSVNAPESFYQGGADRNLNKADASLTFWFVPQDITADLEVTVTVKVWAKDQMSTEKVLKLNMGELILAQTNATNWTWKAGQLRTFTLKPNIVNVDIEDDVDGFIKKDVVITNTGNVDAYIRANIVANWMGTTDTGVEGVALGYTTPTRTAFVAPWVLDYPDGDNYGGEFTNLPGSDWFYANDGYFYYMNPVAPGAPTGSPLFDKYTNTDDNVPEIYYLSSTGVKAFANVRMYMDLTVQAIEAKAEYADFRAAWAAAGVTVNQ